MLYIKFTRKSLLYGQSLIWLIFSFFIPFYLWPNFETTRSELIIYQLPFARPLIRFFIYISKWKILRRFVPRIVIITQVVYIFILLTLSVLVHEDLVHLLGLSQGDSLMYKSTYYGPLFYRIGMAAITLRILAGRQYPEWLVYDKYEIFSIRNQIQLSSIIWCSLSILPDILATLFDLLFLISMSQHRGIYPLIGYLRTNNYLGRCLLWLFMTFCSTNVLLRYKPLLNIMYSSICVRLHLNSICNQLSASCGCNSSSPLLFSFSSKAREKKEQVAAGMGHSSALIQANGAHPARASQVLITWAAIEHSDLKTPNPTANGAITSPTLDRFLRRRLAAGGDEERVELAAMGKALASVERLCTISNLYQLERHLTELELFRSDIDRQAPMVAYLLIIGNMIANFYSTFYALRLGLEGPGIFFTPLFLTARLLPLVVLFVSSDSMEKAARRLLNQLERLYLQDESQSLLYKQTSGTQLSLARVFRLLERLKFTCNGLVSLNLASLTQFILYLGTGVFVVVQYDIIVSVDNNTSGNFSLTARNLTLDTTKYQPELNFGAR